MQAAFEIYRGNIWFHWQLKVDGRTIAECGGFKTRAATLRAIEDVKMLAPNASQLDFSRLRPSKPRTAKKRKKS
jgi:uncharacterized protein YegP (UPF0339 family)